MSQDSKLKTCSNFDTIYCPHQDDESFKVISAANLDMRNNVCKSCLAWLDKDSTESPLKHFVAVVEEAVIIRNYRLTDAETGDIYATIAELKQTKDATINSRDAIKSAVQKLALVSKPLEI